MLPQPGSPFWRGRVFTLGHNFAVHFGALLVTVWKRTERSKTIQVINQLVNKLNLNYEHFSLIKKKKVVLQWVPMFIGSD